MSGTTAIESKDRYYMVGVFYHQDSDEIVSSLLSRGMTLELGVKPDLEHQSVARMVLTSCNPKIMEGFNMELARRQRRLGPTAVLLPPFVIKYSDVSKVTLANTVLDLVRKGLIHDPQL
jgi:hypothetical protein